LSNTTREIKRKKPPIISEIKVENVFWGWLTISDMGKYTHVPTGKM